MQNSVLALLVTSAAGLAAASDHGLDLPPYKKLVLENGATLLLVPHREVPVATFQILIRGGSVTDPIGKDGVSSLAGELLRKGAGARTSRDIALALDERGASLDVSTGLTGTTVTLDLLAEDAPFALDLLADLLLRPSFPEEEFVKLRERSIDGLKSAKENPQSVIPAYFARALFGDHPFARSSTGTETTLAALGRADVATQWTRLLAADRLIIAVGGDIDEAAVESAARKAFGGLAKASEPLAPLPEPKRVTGRRVVLVDAPDAVQTYFWIGNVGIPERYDHDAAFDVVRTAFGGRFTSMLNTALRIDSGLTYGARLTVERLEVAGRLAITSFTETKKTKEAIDLALATLKRLHDAHVAKEVLKSAQAYLRGQLPPTLETASAVTGAILGLVRFDQPDTTLTRYFANLDAVTPALAASVIDSVFPKGEDLVIVLIGRAADIGELAKGWGPVELRSLSEPGF